LGDAYLAQGEFEKALASYEEAALDAAVRWQAYKGIGRVHLAAGRLGEAERALRTALFVSIDQPIWNSEEGDVFHYLGQVYEAQGELAKAVVAYEKSVPRLATFTAYGIFLWHRATLPLPEPAWLRQLDIVRTTPAQAARFAALERVYMASGDEDGVRRLRELRERVADAG
jgi:tetratricopeptide (TPR) repeat protein